MSWEIRVPKRVKKSIKLFPKEDHGRILQALHEFSFDPWHGDIEKIGGKENLWRKRIGNYRIFYSPQISSKVVEVKEIRRRTSNTY